MEDPQTRPELFHPQLRDKTRAYTYPRMSWLMKWWFPESERIGWFGDVVRPDGKQGMHCTLAQYEAWPHKVSQGDIRIG